MNLNNTLVAAAFAGLSSITPALAHDAHGPNEARLHAIEHMFEDASLVGQVRLVDCTLSGGAQTTCVSLTVKPRPTTHEAGPWCPETVDDGPAQSGVWFNDGALVDADGKFMSNLATFYDDPEWQIFDPETGRVNVTRTQEACEAAARPDVDPRYRNHCVQCQLDAVPADITSTYVFPLTPVAADQPRPIRGSGAGLALDGVKLDGPAPVDAILGAHTIAPFDDCGGHVNPHAGYHYHAVTTCLEGKHQAAEAADAPVVGLAMDGYEIRSRTLADGAGPAGLDQCQGHTPEGDTYHYHAGEPGSNQIIGCLTAQHGCVLPNPEMTCDATRERTRAGADSALSGRLRYASSLLPGSR